MTNRLAPLALLAALAALACTPTVAPPAVPTSASPSAAASAAASAMPSTAASAAASPAASPSASPSAAASASPNPAGGGTEPDAHEAEACEHVEEGPGVAVTANLVTMSRERGVVSDDHKRYDVGLVQTAGQYEGYVLFESAAAGEYEIYLNKDVPFKLMQNGKEITPEASTGPLGGCPNVVKKVVHAELGIGQVELHFGPTTESVVGLVMEHHDDE